MTRRRSHLRRRRSSLAPSPGRRARPRGLALARRGRGHHALPQRRRPLRRRPAPRHRHRGCRRHARGSRVRRERPLRRERRRVGRTVSVRTADGRSTPPTSPRPTTFAGRTVRGGRARRQPWAPLRRPAAPDLTSATSTPGPATPTRPARPCPPPFSRPATAEHRRHRAGRRSPARPAPVDHLRRPAARSRRVAPACSRWRRRRAGSPTPGGSPPGRGSRSASPLSRPVLARSRPGDRTLGVAPAQLVRPVAADLRARRSRAGHRGLGPARGP